MILMSLDFIGKFGHLNVDGTQDWKIATNLRSLNDFGKSGSSNEARIILKLISQRNTLDKRPSND